MDADDGSDATRLTDNDEFVFDPSWSPDGEKDSFYQVCEHIHNGF